MIPPEAIQEIKDHTIRSFDRNGMPYFVMGPIVRVHRTYERFTEGPPVGWEGRIAQVDAKPDGPRSPEIRKLSTLDLDMVEATPVVFKDRLYLFEYVRKDYHANKTGDSCF